jgi:hypothetical protein
MGLQPIQAFGTEVTTQITKRDDPIRSNAPKKHSRGVVRRAKMHQNGAQVVTGQTQCTIVVQFIESFLRNCLNSKAYM